MRVAKSGITRTIKLIKEHLPDGADIYGYSGINKDLLCEGLNETYGLLSALEKDRDTFDIIYLKRRLAKYNTLITEYFKDTLREGVYKNDKFDKFLDDIFSIRKDVKECYLLVVEGSLRDESRLQVLKEDVDNYQEILDSYKEHYTGFSATKESIDDIKTELTDFYKQFSDSSDLVSKTVSIVESTKDEVNVFSSDAKAELEQIYEIKRLIVRNKVAYNGAEKRYKAIAALMSEKHEDVENLLQSMSGIDSRIQEQQKSIQDIVDDANRASMAGSFRKRKDELDAPIKMSGIIMNTALVVIGIISALLLYISGIATNQFDVTSFLIKLPVIAPFVWIAWSNSLRNNYLVRIREDYAFKYASAMAFEGYKKQVQDTDPNLEKRLLELSVENMGANPIRLFDKVVKTSPMHEVTSTIKDIISTTKKEKL
ncbi:hypothetical protein C0W42_11300 [Photobacterium kishitanii]|uniref:hypothetical protein n=1 Tax=Photobacterium kishitanii TaxID=318456 RepID=UPI000D169C6F|nr:hypothetical protein [Photobacterium kishitanii]PSU88916.1 hypothetical protein C0W42_11300 [Photobacterium kishitanii]